jgi:hypothetical protein
MRQSLVLIVRIRQGQQQHVPKQLKAELIPFQQVLAYNEPSIKADLAFWRLLP